MSSLRQLFLGFSRRSLPVASKLFLAALLARLRRTGITESTLADVTDEARRMGIMAQNKPVEQYLLTPDASPSQVDDGFGVAPSTPSKRGRPAATKVAMKESSPDVPIASTSKVTIETLQETAEEEGSDCELLLVAEKRTPPRQPRTPPRSIRLASTHYTPRMILDAVEVPTPSQKMRDLLLRRLDQKSTHRIHALALKHTGA